MVLDALKYKIFSLQEAESIRRLIMLASRPLY